MLSLFRRPRPTVDDWFDRAKPEELQEYSAFGPWVHEVQNRQDVPPRFLPWYPELTQADYILKIPINKDRRDARPGQDLYRALVAVDADRLVFLTLNDSGTVEYRSVPFTDIQAFRNFYVLLHAECALYFRDGSQFSFSYNAVSRSLIERVLDFLSGKLGGAAGTNTEVENGPAFGGRVVDPYFQNLARDQLFRQPGRIIFCEEPGLLYRDKRHRRQRSLGLLVLKTGAEWRFLDRGSAVGQSSASAYAGSLTWIPLSRSPLFHLQQIDSAHPQSGRQFIIQLPGHQLSYRVLGSAEALNALTKKPGAANA